MNDFLAYIPMMTGGSYGRAETPTKAVRNAVECFVSDWGSIFDVFDKKTSVHVANVKGHDKINFGPNKGIWTVLENGEDHVFDFATITVHVPALTGKPDTRHKKRYQNKIAKVVETAVENNPVM